MLERNIGDKVFVVADNYGQDAVIIEYRENEDPLIAPASHWKVRTSDGQEFWAFDFEISEPIDPGAIKRVHALFMQKLAAEYPDHPWLKKGAK